MQVPIKLALLHKRTLSGCKHIALHKLQAGPLLCCR